MRPRFSVILTVHNDADVVSRAVAGVLSQTFGNFELVVIDAGSTDDSVLAVRAVADRRVRVLNGVPAESGGSGDPTERPQSTDSNSPPSFADHSVSAAAARALGVTQARGAWLLLLDPNDEVSPGWLARMGRLIDSSGADFVSCGGTQQFSDASLAEIRPVTIPRLGSVRACLRPGAFAAPAERYREVLENCGPDPVDVGLRLVTATLDAGDSVVATPEPLIRWHEPSASEEEHKTGDALRLRWALQAIDAVARTPIPDGELLARYATIGGVAAARLREHRQSRRLFRVARRAVPEIPGHWLRWAASLVPLAADRIWEPSTLP